MIHILLEDDGHFRANGKLKIKNFSSIVISEVVENTLVIFGLIGATYRKYMLDKQLIGQEKANLTQMLNRMTSNLVLMRFYFENRYFESNLPSAENFEDGFNFTMYMDDFDFTINGKLSPKIYMKIKSFKQWYENNFTLKLKEFLSDLKEALKDGHLSEEEVKWLNKRLNGMIHLQLIMHYKLNRAKMQS